MQLQNEGLNVSANLADEILQRHVEAYFVAIRDLQGDNRIELSTPERMGNYVRAALRSEILNGYVEDDVSNMTPAQVAWLAAQLDDIIAEALTIPPN